MDSQEQVSISVRGNRAVVNTPSAVQDAHGNAGHTTSSKGQQTQGQVGNTNIVVQGTRATTVNGDCGTVVTGKNNPVSESKHEVIGSAKLINSGNAAAANQGIAKIAATAAQDGDDAANNFSISAVLGGFASSITNATVAIDKSNVKPFQATGDMVMDFMNLANYYIDMLTQFTIKNTLKRIMLAIRLEVEKIKIQLEETERLLKSIPNRFQKLKARISGNPTAALAAPSKENKKGGKTLTKKQVNGAVIPDAQKNLEAQRNV